jgi:hypothetical protein
MAALVGVTGSGHPFQLCHIMQRNFPAAKRNPCFLRDRGTMMARSAPRITSA